MRMRIGWYLAGAMVLGAPASGAGQVYEENLPLDHRAVAYWRGPLDNPISRLASRLESGEVRLTWDPGGLSYLPALFEELEVSVDSQVLVFSKTSLLRGRISPRQPRAIFFNDEVMIGFVPGSDVIELATIDPERGAVFYRMDARRVRPPRFVRPDGCLECHQGAATLGIPGIYVGSVITSPSGRADFRTSIVTDHRTPFEDRWGGWYVNGSHGSARHRGNAVSSGPAMPSLLEPFDSQSSMSLARKFDATEYPSPVSDIVALMTLEHQTQMSNLLIRLSWEARMEEEEEGEDSRLAPRIDEVARYMLFLDEPPLEAPIKGVSVFTQTFPRRGPHDRHGRSLRDFDLQTRLFRHPLSYMIYSPTLSALPEPVKNSLHARLHDLLSAHPPETQKAILEILRDTLP